MANAMSRAPSTATRLEERSLTVAGGAFDRCTSATAVNAASSAGMKFETVAAYQSWRSRLIDQCRGNVDMSSGYPRKLCKLSNFCLSVPCKRVQTGAKTV